MFYSDGTTPRLQWRERYGHFVMYRRAERARRNLFYLTLGLILAALKLC